MKKKSILIFLILIFYLPWIAGNAWASSQLDPVVNQLDNVDLSSLNAYIEQIDRDVSQYYPELNLQNLLDDLKHGRLQLNFHDFLAQVIKFFLHEILSNSKLLGILIILAIINAVLENMQTAFNSDSLSKITSWVCGLALYTIALGSFTLTMGIARDTIDKMANFFNSLLPVLITLIVSVGHVTSAALLSPLTIACTGFFSNLLNQVVLPLIYISTVLFILDHINVSFKVTYLAKLGKDISLGIIGVSLTIFIGVLTIQGLAGGVTDGIALETARFATGSFIPVVGKFLSEAIEVVVGTSMLIKNGVSIVGVLLISLICLFPMIKILSIGLIYRVAAALVQPFGAKQIAEALQTISNCLMLVFGAVASSCLIFFIAISILVKVGRPF